MKDPVLELAGERLIEMAIDLKVQLEKGTGTRPVLWLLAKAKERAATAIYALTKIDPDKKEEIRHLQNEVSLYSDMIESCQQLFTLTQETVQQIDEEDREAIADLLTTEEAREMGITPQPED